MGKLKQKYSLYISTNHPKTLRLTNPFNSNVNPPTRTYT